MSTRLTLTSNEGHKRQLSVGESVVLRDLGPNQAKPVLLKVVNEGQVEIYRIRTNETQNTSRPEDRNLYLFFRDHCLSMEKI
jgi:hypothetical protein